MPLDPLKGPENLSPHCMPVKVLGHTNLPFFTPTGLTALQTLHGIIYNQNIIRSKTIN